jgi:Protein of unknown function (DUF2510)
MEQELPRPGWYPDPAGGERRRWWDGARWTENLEPDPSELPPPVIEAPTAEPEPEPEHEAFVPLHIPSSGGAHGGGPAEPEPEHEAFVPLYIPSPGDTHGGGPAPGDEAPATPSGLPLPSAPAVPAPPGVASDKRRPLVVAGAVAGLVVVTLLAAVTFLGKEAPSAEGAYDACKESMDDASFDIDEVEFQPEDRVTTESYGDGVAVEYWVDDQVTRSFFRCEVDTSGADPAVTDLWVDLGELMDSVQDVSTEGRFESVGSSISG